MVAGKGFTEIIFNPRLCLRLEFLTSFCTFVLLKGIFALERFATLTRNDFGVFCHN